MISIQERQSHEIHDALKFEYNCTVGSDALQRAVISDHIRALIFGAWTRQQRTPGAGAVHTTRLLANVRRIHSFLWPQDGWQHGAVGDLCRQVLDSLAALGDIVTIGGGFWIPGPLVLIELDGADNVMATGGFPAADAKQLIGVSLSSVAGFRYTARRAVLANHVNKAVLHPADWWFGHADPLVDWTRGVLRQHEARLSSEMGLSVEQCEIYAPEIFRDQRKVGRWMRAVQVPRPLDGLRLCRPISNSRNFGAIYFLGSFRFDDGSLILSRSAPIAADLTRRLRFGFDALLGATRQVSIPIDTTSFIFDNSVALPESESRVLSLAWRNLQSPTDNSQSHFFHVNALPLVLCALARLCITPTLINRRLHA
jgi:hypothetical protein